MNEQILKALMQLFAIVANVNKEGDIGLSRTIVRAYLKNQLNKKLQNEYLKLFDDYLEFHHKGTEADEKARKKTAANSVKVLMICQQINENLQQDQKILVVIQLLEFIRNGFELTQKEKEFVETVAETFNISESEYANINSFVMDHPSKLIDKTNYLLVGGTKQNSQLSKHIYREGVDWEIHVLHIESTEMYAFKFIGTTDLYLNGTNIPIDRTLILDKGSAIRGKKLNPIYYSDIVGEFLHSKSKSKIIFTAQNVEFRFKNSSNGIQKFNFYEESGQLIGIMGGSGVGKSTLLNVLNGNLKPQTGTITINGKDIHADKNDLKGVIGFVPQDDLLIEELTVYQNLFFNSKLCFDGFTDIQINELVYKILSDLELTEIKDLTVGNPLNKFISGGQRKRLNIALELIREPSVLFVDEPTSGLSSMDSEMVMDLLKEQTLKGKLVIINIHQPSSDIYKMFDKLLIMDKGGYLIYNGNPLDAITYFKRQSNYVNADESECITCGNVNPEQVLQIVESKIVDEYGKLTKNRKVSPTEWHELFIEEIESKNKDIPENLELPENFFKIPNLYQQFKIFFIRNVLAKLTDKQYMLINFLEAPLLALICGFFTKYIAGTPDDPSKYIFSQNENLPSYLFMCVIAILFIGLTVSAEEIIKDRKILQRERFLNLSWMSYINSKVILLFIISAIQTFSFVFIGNWVLEIKELTMHYFLIMFSLSCFANLLGLNISAGLNSVVTIYILIPLLLVPQLLLSGVIVKFEKLHKSISSYQYVSVVGDIMPSRWAYEALAINQFVNNRYQKHFFNIEQQMSIAAFNKNFLIPELLTKLDNVKNNIKKRNNPQGTQKDLDVIYNELSLLQKTYSIEYNNFKNLTIVKFDENTYDETKKLLSIIKQKNVDLYNKFYNLRDDTYKLLIDSLGKDGLITLKNNYFNESLADLVLNNNELNKIVEQEGRLIQFLDPAYNIPENKMGRSHFYAAKKRIGSFIVDTVWFNIIIIWLMTTILYVTLSNNSLRKLIEKLEKIKIRR
ncbi:MAG: ATP-binding cassette domain-containing protein [Bacteroidales bacterium]|nr:ATP-binding cassette domain-containing protein [Bacteroidales bacterium]